MNSVFQGAVRFSLPFLHYSLTHSASKLCIQKTIAYKRDMHKQVKTQTETR